MSPEDVRLPNLKLLLRNKTDLALLALVLLTGNLACRGRGSNLDTPVAPTVPVDDGRGEGGVIGTNTEESVPVPPHWTKEEQRKDRLQEAEYFYPGLDPDEILQFSMVNPSPEAEGNVNYDIAILLAQINDEIRRWPDQDRLVLSFVGAEKVYQILTETNPDGSLVLGSYVVDGQFTITRSKLFNMLRRLWQEQDRNNETLPEGSKIYYFQPPSAPEELKKWQ